MNRSLAAAVAAGALAFSASAALAVPITPSPTLTSAGNTFDTFGCNVLALGAIAQPTNCNQIDVSATGGNLTIQSGFVAGLNSFDDALLTYHVHSDAGIDAIDLSFNGSFLGLAVTGVTEIVRTGPGQFAPIVGALTVSCSTGLPCDLQDPAFETPPDIPLTGTFKDLWITKDIVVAAGIGTGTISVIGQSFHQVPEPASMAIFGSALVGIGLLRRRRKDRKQTS